jgi:hypothetical protein
MAPPTRKKTDAAADAAAAPAAVAVTPAEAVAPVAAAAPVVPVAGPPAPDDGAAVAAPAPALPVPTAHESAVLQGLAAFAFDQPKPKPDDQPTLREADDVPKAGAPSPTDLAAMAALVRSDNPAFQQQGTMKLRQLLSREKDPPIDAVVRLGVIPDFVRLLSCDDNPEVQFEALWALTNIASSDQTIEITRNIPPNSADAVPETARLLRSPSDKVREQAIWCVPVIASFAPCQQQQQQQQHAQEHAG